MRAFPRCRGVRRTGVAFAGCLVAATVATPGQELGAGQPSPGAAPSEANHFIETPAGWVHPVTPWGDPDLQGTWPVSFVGSVPLQRCAPAFGGGPRPGSEPCDRSVAFVDEETYRARLERAARRTDRHAEAIADSDFGAALQSGTVDPTAPQRQTSLIVDPPDGQLPPMTPEGERLSALMRSSWSLSPDEHQVWDSPLDFDTWDRCITRGMPSSMMPFRYNNGIEILQAPGYVVLNLEMIHEARIVPVDGRSPLDSAIRGWMGESRGHWEGTTLVVVTTNFRAGASATNIGVDGSPEGNRFPTSERMVVTERFSRLNDDMLLYEITTDDPVVLTRPWTARYPLRLDLGYQWWEYACHEGNRTIMDYITASRAEQEAAGSR